MAEPHFQQKLSFVEKAGYSAGDSAANFVFMTMVLFQLNFYTDVFGLTASAALDLRDEPFARPPLDGEVGQTGDGLDALVDVFPERRLLRLRE